MNRHQAAVLQGWQPFKIYRYENLYLQEVVSILYHFASKPTANQELYDTPYIPCNFLLMDVAYTPLEDFQFLLI